MTTFPPRRAALLAGAALLVLAARAARADEIVYEDPETCARVTLTVEQVTSETWTEVAYVERARGPEKTIPTPQVIDIHHTTDDPQARRLATAVRELERGNAAEAARALQALSGGGYQIDLQTRERTYRPFTADDPPGRGKRPPWLREYAHFFYARALVAQGLAENNKDLLGEALLALEDRDVPGVPEKTSSGGFLKRFDGGNSRWYPAAMLLRAEVLLALGRYDEAKKAFEELQEKALAVGLGPRWVYEAQIGPGRIAEAKGNALEAVNQYKDASNFMKLMLRDEARPCARRALGRLYSRARMRAAAVMLAQAEKTKSAAELEQLRRFIEEGMPDALRTANRTLPPSQLDALVAGAMDPDVQAIAHNGLGLAHLAQNQFDEAILHFRQVEVSFFEEAEEHARALHYLAQAADGAAKAARSPEAKALYEKIRDGAVQRLKADHPDSRWARAR